MNSKIVVGGFESSLGSKIRGCIEIGSGSRPRKPLSGRFLPGVGRWEPALHSVLHGERSVRLLRLDDVERQRCHRFVFFAGLQNRRREVVVIDGIREVLRFEAQAAAMSVGLPILRLLIHQEVSAVELNARLLSHNSQHTARLSVAKNGRQIQLRIFFLRLVQNEIVVIAQCCGLCEFFDAVSDFCWFAEVQWRAFHSFDFPCWNQRVIRGSVFVGVQHQHVIENRVAASACEVEVRVVGQIDGRRLIGGRLVVDDEAVFFSWDKVRNRDLKFSRVAFFTIGLV